MGLGEQFTKTLREAVNSVAIFDYGKKEDFEVLWGTKDANGSHAFLNSTKTNREIVVVWDGRDVGGNPSANLLKQHLTPLDWALAISLAVLAKSNADAFDSIHIVDITGKVHEEWAMRMRHQLLVEMPWVTLHAPLIPDDMVFRQGYQPIISEGGKDGLLKEVDGGSWYLIPLRKKLSECQNRVGDLRKTAKQWAASLTQSRDHHDVNNIIGPEILSRGAKCQDVFRSAFLNRLDWCDLDLQQVGVWDSWDPRPAVLKLFNRTLTVLTVDDQLDQGWGRFACRLFGNRKFDKNACLSEDIFTRIETNYDKLNVAVFGCLSASPVIEFLETAHFTSRNYAQQIPIGNNPEL